MTKKLFEEIKDEIKNSPLNPEMVLDYHGDLIRKIDSSFPYLSSKSI